MGTFGRAVLAVVLAVAAFAVPQVAGAPPAHAAERTITYSVTAQGSVRGDLGEFAAVAASTLADPRGWSLGGTLAFQRVASGGEFTLILASPAVVGAASPGCDRTYSCRVGRNVYINDERWRTATPSWPHGLALYRPYVILHEVGHWLGLGHTGCSGSGRSAPVMQQQSISLQGCRGNVWPLVAERAQVGRNTGVPVGWSAVERRYLALGQAAGVLGGPTSWETSTPDGRGRYQHFSRPGGASIYWSPGTGAWEIWGGIRTRWAQLGWERSTLGYPVTGERAAADGVGRFQNFARPGGASIYWSPRTGAHEVYGGIRTRWGQEGWELGPLGYPVSGEYDVPGGRRSDFQGGSITWDRRTGTTTVTLT